MLVFVFRRILYSIPVLLATSFIIFTTVSAVGDPLANLKMNPNVSKVTLAKIVHDKHLDEPIPLRYLYWLKDAAHGDFGTYLLRDRPVWSDLER